MDFNFLYEWARSLAPFVLNPFYQLCFLFLTSFVVVIFAPKKRYRFLVLFISTLYFLVVTTPWVPNLLIKTLQTQYIAIIEKDPKRAVVVLNGGVILYDNTSRQFQWGGAFARGGEGLRLIKKNFAHYLIISGATPYDHTNLEEEGPALKRLAKELGIPEERVIVENESLNTFDHPQKLKKIFERYGIKDFYLVTSATHMLRAQLVFEAQGLTPTPYPVDFIPTEDNFGFGLQYLGRVQTAFHEYFGIFAYWYTKRL